MNTFLVSGFRERRGICTLLNWEKLLESCRSEATLWEALKHTTNKNENLNTQPKEKPKYSFELRNLEHSDSSNSSLIKHYYDGLVHVELLAVAGDGSQRNNLIIFRGRKVSN